MASQWAEVLQSVWRGQSMAELVYTAYVNNNEYSLYFSVYQDCHSVLLLFFTATKSSQTKFRRLKGEISDRLVAHNDSALPVTCAVTTSAMTR